MSWVADNTVRVTFVNLEGSRQTVPGRVGQTVHDVARMHDVNLGYAVTGDPRERQSSDVWTEDLFGEDCMDAHDHVYVPPEWLSKLPEIRPYERDIIAQFWEPEEVSDSSRLASKITLTKDLDGITVFVPDQIPVDHC